MATVMVHEVITGRDGAASTTEIQTEAEETARLNDLACGILDRVTKKRTGSWYRLLKKSAGKDCIMTAKDAVKLGLADRIGVPWPHMSAPELQMTRR